MQTCFNIAIVNITGHTVFTLHQIREPEGTVPGATTEFQEWLTSNILSYRDIKSVPFPATWFHEFQTFYSQDNISHRIQQLFSSVDFTSSIQETINSIWTISRRLHQFFSHRCGCNFQTHGFPECFASNRTNITLTIKEFLQAELLHLPPAVKKHHSNMFSLWVGTQRIATWEQGTGLTVSDPEFFQRHHSYCSGINCTVCDQNDGYFSRNHHSVLYETNHYPWATTLGGLSLFGAFLTILTAMYFLAVAALPKSNLCSGTSVLGYLILLGLLLLFTANLSFVLTPTEATCGARRFLPGFAYTVIFAGMLLKVTYCYQTILLNYLFMLLLLFDWWPFK
jgi:hypothetical protein